MAVRRGTVGHVQRPPSVDTPRRRARRRVRLALLLVSIVPALGVAYWYAVLGVLGCVNFEDETLFASVFTGGVLSQLVLVIRARGRPHWSSSIALATWVVCGALGLLVGFEASAAEFPLSRPRVPGWNTVLDEGEANLAFVPWLHALLWLAPVAWLSRPPRDGPVVPRA